MDTDNAKKCQEKDLIELKQELDSRSKKLTKKNIYSKFLSFLRRAKLIFFIIFEQN